MFILHRGWYMIALMHESWMYRIQLKGEVRSYLPRTVAIMP